MITSRERPIKLVGAWAIALAQCAGAVAYAASPTFRAAIGSYPPIAAFLAVFCLLGPLSFFSAAQSSTRRVHVGADGVQERFALGRFVLRERRFAWPDVGALDARSNRTEMLGVSFYPTDGAPIALGLWDTGLSAAAVIAVAHVPSGRWSDTTSVTLERIASGAVEPAAAGRREA